MMLYIVCHISRVTFIINHLRRKYAKGIIVSKSRNEIKVIRCHHTRDMPNVQDTRERIGNSKEDGLHEYCRGIYHKITTLYLVVTIVKLFFGQDKDTHQRRDEFLIMRWRLATVGICLQEEDT